MAREVNNSDDIIDSRDVIARISELENECRIPCNHCTGMASTDCEVCDGMGDFDPPTRETYDPHNPLHDAKVDELFELWALKDLEGQAEGYTDWCHGATLIRDTYFESYARELAEEIGAINTDTSWPATCIDWEQAARELQMDYTAVEFDGVTYWVR